MRILDLLQSDLKLVHLSLLSLEIVLESLEIALNISIRGQDVLLDVSLILICRNKIAHFLFSLLNINRNLLDGIFDQVDEFARLLNQLLGVGFDLGKDLLLEILVLGLQLVDLTLKICHNILILRHPPQNIILLDLVGLDSLESETEHILVYERIVNSLEFFFVGLKFLV